MPDIAESLATAPDAKIVEVSLAVSTGKEDAKVRKEFSARLPKSLRDAVDILGEKQVFRMFANALVIDLQGEERQKLTPAGEPKTRKRASYLETLGL